MGMNGIGNTAASWAQFVRITQAARDRNSGLVADGAQPNRPAPSPQNANAVSFKRIADVYLASGKQAAQAQGAAAPSIQNEMNRKTVGGQFDAYA